MVAGLAQTGLQSSEANTTYVSPAWIRSADEASLSNLLERDSRTMLLNPDFTHLDRALTDRIRQTPFGPSDISNIWPLLTERLSLENHGGTIDVYAINYLTQFGAIQTRLPHKINWHITRPAAKPAPGKRTLNAVIVYDAVRRDDAEIISTALATIKAHRLPGLTYRLASSEQINEKELDSDWFFLLTEQPLTSGQLSRIKPSATVLMDTGKEIKSEQQFWATLPYYPFSNFSISRMGRAETGSRSLVVAGKGIPIFLEKHEDRIRILQFSSRFNPAWNSLTRQPEFPEFLLQLMLGEEQQTQSFADARVDAYWLQLDRDSADANIPLPRRSLQSLLAILLALLWITERWLSERKARDDH
jgi:hypothetical protein